MLTCTFCGSTSLEKLRALPVVRCRCGIAYNAQDFAPDPRLSTQPYFQSLREAQDQSGRFFEIWVDQIARFLPPRQGWVLDVGFGYGVFLEKMAKKGFTVWGIELSELSCRSIQQRLSAARTFVGSLTDPFVYEVLKGRSFDLISFWDCLQYIPDAAHQLGLADSLLAKGGLLIVQVPNRGLGNLKYAQAISRLYPRLGRFFLHMPAAKTLFDPEALKKWLLGLGGGYRMLVQSPPEKHLRFSIRLGSAVGAAEDILSLGWACLARQRGETISSIFVLRKR